MQDKQSFLNEKDSVRTNTVPVDSKNLTRYLVAAPNTGNETTVGHQPNRRTLHLRAGLIGKTRANIWMLSK
jgi:hypothetical protein